MCVEREKSMHIGEGLDLHEVWTTTWFGYIRGQINRIAHTSTIRLADQATVASGFCRCKWYTGTLHLMVRKTLGCNFMLFSS